jgi:hypothetical protein
MLALLMLMDALPVLLVAVSLGVFCGVAFGRRLTAAGFGFCAGILGLAVMASTFKDNPYIGGGFLAPPAAYVLRLTDFSSMPHPQGTVQELVVFYAGAFLIIALLAILARAWLRWKENF